MTTAEIDSLDRDGTWRVSRSLYVQTRGQNRSWLMRFRWRGRPVWMGLGATWLVPLTTARRKVLNAQRLLHDGIDPRKARDDERKTTVPSFDEVADACITALAPGWRSPKQEVQWRNQLRSYATPLIGKIAVDEVTPNHVFKILEPVWAAKIETATRLRERVEKVLDFAEAAGHRSGPNPARWKGGLEHRLPKPSAVANVEHHPAVPLADAVKVYRAIAATPTMTANLLRFIILTATRFGEASRATWSEVNLDSMVWTIPPSRTKTNRELRVPLSDEAVAVLRSVRPDKTRPGDLVFPAARGKPLSDAAPRKLLRKVTADATVTVHGWRSTFRDWVAETGLDADAAEQALGHRAGDAVVTAYLRSDVLDRRRVLMKQWASFLLAAVSDAVAPVPGPSR